MFIQPDWWEVTKPGVGTNRYGYSFGDPVNKMDPGGNDVVFVDGTNSNGDWRRDDPNNDEDLYSNVQRSFPDQDIHSLENTNMDNTHDARMEAARNLAALIERIRSKDPHAEINIVAHSHGLNVAKAASQMSNIGPIDRVIGMGGPQRIGGFRNHGQIGPEYHMNTSTVETYINVYSVHDNVQAHGGVDGNVVNAGLSRESAGRVDPTADFNIEASWFGGWDVDHYSFSPDDQATIHSGGVWGRYIDRIIE